MYKHLSIPPLSALQVSLETKRQDAIRPVMDTLSSVPLEGVLARAEASSRARLSLGPDEATARRLQQRLDDLVRIKAVFATEKGLTFLGVYGWGEGCQIQAKPGEGISEYDTIVYLKNGKTYVEKIGSCWELFTMFPKPKSVAGTELTVTEGGVISFTSPSVKVLKKGSMTRYGFGGMSAPFTETDDPNLFCFACDPITSLATLPGSSGTGLKTKKSQQDSISQRPVSDETASLLTEMQHTKQQTVDIRPVLRSYKGKGWLGIQPHSCSDPKCSLNPKPDGSKPKYTKDPVSTVKDVAVTDTDPTSKQRTSSVVTMSPIPGVQGGNPLFQEEEETPLIAPTLRPYDPLVFGKDEGCPCCMNAMDLDELAGVGKAVDDAEGAAHATGSWASPTGQDWLLLAGLGGPFAFLGAVAAYRNMTGSYVLRQDLLAKLQEVQTLIAEEDTPQRRAFATCLRYSLFDASWNMCVPGVLNGTNALAVLSTLVVSSPAAMPAMGVYATAQTGRGLYDIAYHWHRWIQHDKVDQITWSKRRFYMSNTTAFGCMAAGAVLVGVSPLTFGATLIPGLCLLIPGTVVSGVLNNIWPRKFRPRNGDLGVPRADLNAETCLRMIDSIREKKSEIKWFKKRYLKTSVWTEAKRVGFKLAATLPWCDTWAAGKLHTLMNTQIESSRDVMARHQGPLFETLGLPEDTAIEDVLIGGLKTLRYRQYGLYDFYWALKQEEGRAARG